MESVEEIVACWPDEQKKTALDITRKYGKPQDASVTRLSWYDNSPWKRTIVHRDAQPHNFPTPHQDYLEQTVNYRSPLAVFDAIAHYDGSCYIDRTKGEVTAVCNKEEMNMLAINLFHEIVIGKHTVNEARDLLAEIAENFLIYHKSSPYVEKFLFSPQFFNTADPDVSYF